MYMFSAIDIRLSAALAMSHTLQCVVFLFSFCSEYFLIFLFISSFTHGLFWHVLLNFQMFVDFSEIFLLLVSKLIPFWSYFV